MNKCFTIWQQFLLQNLTFGFTVFFDFHEHARQLSMLRIIQAWIQTFAEFMHCLSLRAGKLLNKVLPKYGCAPLLEIE